MKQILKGWSQPIAERFRAKSEVLSDSCKNLFDSLVRASSPAHGKPFPHTFWISPFYHIRILSTQIIRGCRLKQRTQKWPLPSAFPPGSSELG